jgi:hypothetical protein
MEKIKLVFPEIEKIELDFNGQKIEISTFIGRENRAIILSAMSESQNENPSIRFIENEGGLIFAVLDRMTNINLDKLNIDKFVASGLWGKVKNSISNFDELFSDIENIKKIETLESKVNRIADKIEKLIDNVLKLDLSTENLKEMVEQIGIGKEQLAEVFPVIKNTSIEAVKKTRKPRKSTKET